MSLSMSDWETIDYLRERQGLSPNDEKSRTVSRPASEVFQIAMTYIMPPMPPWS
jgi:hypothetical protein